MAGKDPSDLPTLMLSWSTEPSHGSRPDMSSFRIHGRTESKDKHETKLPIYCGFFYIVILSVLDGGD